MQGHLILSERLQMVHTLAMGIESTILAVRWSRMSTSTAFGVAQRHCFIRLFSHLLFKRHNSLCP